MSEFSQTMTHEDKLSKSLRLWSRKTRKEHNSIRVALEIIINEAIKLNNAANSSEELKQVPLNDDAREVDRRDDVIEAYKKPKYRYNMTSGTRQLKFGTPEMKIRRYFQYLQLQQYKTDHTEQSLDVVTKAKIVAKANREWRHVSSFERYVLKVNYENLLFKGKDISQDGESIVPVEESEGYDGVVHKILGEVEPGTEGKKKRRIPLLKLILNEMTGYVHVHGLCEFHVWNYYLGRECVSRVGVGDIIKCENVSEVIDQIEKEWIEMTVSQRNNIRMEYMNMLSRGKDLLHGKVVPIEEKRDAIDKPKQYLVVRIRGDSSSFNIFDCEVSPSKFTITQPSKLRFIKNTFVGNTIVVGDLNLVHAWNYFVYKQQQQQQQQKEPQHDGVYDAVQLQQGLMRQWNEQSDDKKKQQYLQEYKSLLVSGHDIYMGEKVPIETKMAKTGVKNLVVDVWGQPITLGTGANVKVAPLPITIDETHDKVLVLSDIADVHAYNYYLAKQLQEHSSQGGGEGGLDYSLIPRFQQEWLEFTPDHRRIYADEYLQLLSSGKDYAFGKIVPVANKLKLSIYSKPSKLVGPGTKSAFYPVTSAGKAQLAKSKEGVIVFDDKIYANALPYYMYSRKAVDTTAIDSSQIVDEWTEMSDKEKFEVQEAYDMMVDAGFAMVNGVLKDMRQEEDM
ncbi:hypothetical protein KGF57_000353 [Candida theae]|uniref:Uncharacterized protein n=1 Tax=Candida theae TaxID=1198502 RepID=A0AAD5BJ31_9ASCO|nr:uncharacterized protein KGF57_000353 [Candida theae]KAI5967513.1 hypothetical protein KGF57_000353 [Candida theae]